MAVELGLQQEIQQREMTTWLRWWDEDGNLLLTGDERAIAEKQARLNAEAIADQERLIANQERQQKEKLEAYLRSLGINPDDL
jgi:hypothetical protein